MLNFFGFVLLFLNITFSFCLIKPTIYSSKETSLASLLTCFTKYKDDIRLLFSCALKEIKEDKNGLIEILRDKDFLSLLRSDILPNIGISGNITKIIDLIIDDSVKYNEELINYINETLYYKDDSNLTFFDFLENILDDFDNKDLKFENIITNISSIFKIESIKNIYNYIMDKDDNLIFNILDDFLKTNDDMQKIYNTIMESVGDYKKEIMNLIFGIIIAYPNRTKVISLVGEFLKEHREAHDNLKSLFKKDEFKYLINYIITNEYQYFYAIKNVTMEREESMDLLFKILNYTDLIDGMMNLLINIEDSKYIMENLPEFIKNITIKDNTFLLNFVRNIIYFLGSLSSSKQEFINDMVIETKSSLLNLFNSRNISSYNISESCLYLFNSTFLNTENHSVWNKTLLTYLRKFVLDSPINKGDFMAYDNCISEDEIKIEGKTKNITHYVKPVFVIGMVDEEKITDLSNSIYYGKYHYITNFCFPFGYIIDSDKNKTFMCNQKDYSQFIQFLLNFFSDNHDRNISDILWYDDTIKLDKLDYAKGILNILILAIPIMIKIGLIISKYILEKKHKKIQKINKLIDEKNIKKINSYNEDELKPTKKMKFSRCYILLNNYFSFYENGMELFNFNLNNTNFNNINGLTYIKGLIGLSIILNVFGLTFTILMNIQIKDYGIYDFYQTMINLFFVFIYIGYRYSPRVLFSCSGYTLTYKYLCFIEQEKGLYFIKFLFLQSYKYIILYFILILFKYSILSIIHLFKDTKRPVWALFDHYLNKESFLYSSFAFLFDFSNYNIQNLSHNYIYYFYMPINEIFCFVFGTILISLGYKFKLRIDIIIIAIFLLFFLLKIFLFNYVDRFGYLTIDYYNFNSGIFFLMPSYNISYYLIGMYFGLINYSIQKGITSIYKENNNYNKYYQLEESNKNNDDISDEINKYAPLNINDENKKENDEYEINNNNQNTDIKLEKYLSKKLNDSEIKNFDKPENEKELIEQIKNMPFLKSPIQFFNFNRKNKDRLCYNILIFLALSIMIFLSYIKSIIILSISNINGINDTKEYKTKISLEYVISNKFLNVVNLIDTDIIVFSSQWLIFILFFKNVTLIRNFCNSIYWSFFVKSYYSYLLVSSPIIICILYESESVIRLNIYNFIFFSLINIVYIIAFVILFYSIYELPLKKLFKSLIKRNEIIDEEEEEENEEEEEKQEDEGDENDLFD